MFLKLLSEPCLFKCSQFPYCDLEVAVGNLCTIFGAAFSRPGYWTELGGGSLGDFLWENLLEAISQSTNACQTPLVCGGTQESKGRFQTQLVSSDPRQITNSISETQLPTEATQGVHPITS